MTKGEFEDAAVVTVAQLGRMAGVDRRRLRRLLAGDRVPLLRTGNRHCICPRDLARVMPGLYDAIMRRLPLLVDVDAEQG
jgi:hypothetical protein